MRQLLKLLGVTTALRHVALRAPCAGMITGLNLQSGDLVRRGQMVARVINQEDLAAQAGLEVARKLDPHSSGSLARDIAPFALNPGVPVVASQPGVVSQRLVSSGQIVAYLDPIVDLIDPASTYVEAAVPIDQSHRLRPGMEATITSPIVPGAVLPGRVAALAPSSNINSATSSARIEFAGAPPIKIAGIAVEVNIITEVVPQAVVVPGTALFEDAANQTYYVFTVDAGRIAHRTSVVPGIRSGSLIQIDSGLRAGQIVITSGGYALSDGLKVSVTIEPYKLADDSESR
jgi:multidrug efflux pump subunit AcrA (membrane-fusion protein)